MVITMTIIILSIVLIAAVFLSRDQTKKKKYIIWGITTMLAIAPLFSWVVSIVYAASEQNGWAGIALMFILFPVLFIVGIFLLLIGIFKKHK